jgi:general secretion pathway protein D
MGVEVIPIRYTIPSEFVTETATSRTAEEMAQTVLNALQPVYPEIRVAVDKRGQNLIVTGTAQAIAAAKDLVAKLDTLSPQVALEVRVVEVAANALSNIGLSMSPIIGSTYTEKDPNATPFIYGRSPISITIILNALAEKGQAKILANPTVATMDGRRALIRTGDDIPLVVRQIFGSTVLENVVTFRAGVTLEIIPKISPDGLITVILKPTVSTITGVTNQGAPQISVREVQTMLTVKDGETIVLGGLLEERDIAQMTKIPLLGDLPILGRLFRSERRDHRRTELIITVTPRILKSPLQETQQSPSNQNSSAP